jgi:hypothetical protein
MQSGTRRIMMAMVKKCCLRTALLAEPGQKEIICPVCKRVIEQTTEQEFEFDPIRLPDIADEFDEKGMFSYNGC